MMADEIRTVTVSQLNEYIKMLIDNQTALKRLCVRGEISNFVYHRSGHLYFTLKDEGSVIRAVMFRSYAQRLKFMPENGMKVIIRGSVSVYVENGQYQLYAEDMQPDGIGGLYLAYEQLRRKLEEKGLFAEERKKALPLYPTRIGIITSPTGAAVQDMINITGRRFPLAEIVIYPALVQGADAPASLISGLKYFNDNDNVDVIIIGRGGGSIEDLWAFNDEALAYAVAGSHIPTISAVGHESDYTICDFVADLRAPTPSAAAELAVPDGNELSLGISGTAERMMTLLTGRLDAGRDKLAFLSSAKVLTSPDSLLNDRRINLDRLCDDLDSAISAVITESKYGLRENAAKLGGLNPLAILSRGYGAVTDTNNEVIKSASELTTGQHVRIRFADGSADAEVKKVDRCE